MKVYKAHIKEPLLKRIWKLRYVYILIIPGTIYYLIFRIAPMYGLSFAFFDYNPFKGLFGSEFIGLQNFIDLFKSKTFMLMFRNTAVISVMNLVFFFPAPIILSLFLNELRSVKLKRLCQTLVYIPHFLSWPVIAGLTFFLVSADVGLLNKILISNGFAAVRILTSESAFWWMLLAQNTWREIGWGSILFLAAMTQVDISLYEAATVDGATRFQRMIRITLPSIMPTIIMLFIIRLGRFMDIGFEQLLLMTNDYVLNLSEVFDTYSYKIGILQGNYGLATAVGFFKSVVALFLVLLFNKIIKKMGQEGIY